MLSLMQVHTKSKSRSYVRNIIGCERMCRYYKIKEKNTNVWNIWKESMETE